MAFFFSDTCSICQFLRRSLSDSGSNCMKFLATTTLSVLTALCVTDFATAWGTEGHEIVANLAWNRLSEVSRDWVTQVLGPVNGTDKAGSPLAAVADWADQVRIYKHWSANLHFIDIRDDLIAGEVGCHVSPSLHPDCRFEYQRDCPDDRCVAGAIVNYTSQLFGLHQVHPGATVVVVVEPNPPQQLAKEALMFLTHFIGDIHQPLHCSRATDKGGNDFHVHFHLSDIQSSSFFSQNNIIRGDPRASSHHSWNLHSVWDSGMIDVSLKRFYNESRFLLEDDLMQRLEANPAFVDDCLSCWYGLNQTCTELWGQESWDVAIALAYTLDDNTTDVEDGATITEEYYETRWPSVMDRLMAGGIRLAATLEALAKSTRTASEVVSTNRRLLRRSD